MSETNARRPRVAVAIPSYDGWHAETGYDVLRLAVYSAPQVDIVPVFSRGQDTSVARNSIVSHCKAQPAGVEIDAILWIDADMTFPPDALIRLLNHRVPIVGADYRKRIPPFDRIGQWFDPQSPFECFPVPADAPTAGLDDKMAMIGFGLILTRMRVFNQPKWQLPWFARPFNPENGTPENPSGFNTEDTVFCSMARAHGFKINCDLDLSAQVGHIAQMTVPWNLASATERKA
jgi:glycosyltransferase involved in cell wall biosynthesis